ncbi:hypothetical protein G3M53_08210 [Streptomyces sp. SID7982]|nr:hypothetical protein [Streptomyces sp. SID7982]
MNKEFPRSGAEPDPHTTPMNAPRKLTRGQGFILLLAAVPMVVFGVIGAEGTYANLLSKFPDDRTAWGVVAGGEGATLMLALVWLGITMLGQSAPTMLRLGLWLLPSAAAGVGITVAETPEEKVVFAITPMAMCVAAEGLGLLARRVVVYRTRVDIEAQRRNAETMQRMAVLRAVAARHPDPKKQKRADKRSWKLAKKIGVGDDELGTGLVTVQRDRLTEGADHALGWMFAPADGTPALPGSVPLALAAAPDRHDRHTPDVTNGAERHGRDGETDTQAPLRHGDHEPAVTVERDRHGHGGQAVTPPMPRHAPGTPDIEPVTPTGTQVSAPPSHESSHRDGQGGTADTGHGAPAVTPTVPEAEQRMAENPQADGDSASRDQGLTLEHIAAVAGVEVPRPDEKISNEQIAVVLRHLRYSDNPPKSYRKSMAEFRAAGFVGSEERIRKVFSSLDEDASSEVHGDTLTKTEDDDQEEDDDHGGPARPQH